MLSHDINESISVKDGDESILRGNNARRTRPCVDSRHLSNGFTRLDVSEGKLLSRCRNT